MARIPRGTRVQSILFDARYHDGVSARTWARSNGYRASNIEHADGLIVMQQEPLVRFEPGSTRRVQLAEGVYAVVANPRDGKGAGTKDPVDAKIQGFFSAVGASIERRFGPKDPSRSSDPLARMNRAWAGLGSSSKRKKRRR